MDAAIKLPSSGGGESAGESFVAAELGLAAASGAGGSDDDASWGSNGDDGGGADAEAANRDPGGGGSLARVEALGVGDAATGGGTVAASVVLPLLAKCNGEGSRSSSTSDPSDVAAACGGSGSSSDIGNGESSGEEMGES